MKKNAMNLLASLTLSTVLVAGVARAGQAVSCDLQQDSCGGAPLAGNELDKTLFLGDAVNAKLEALYQEGKARGEDLKVVLIGRMGTNMKKFKILKDNGGKDSIQVVVQKLLDDSLLMSRTANIDTSSTSGNMIKPQAIGDMVDDKEEMIYSHLGIAFRNLEIEGADHSGPSHKWAFKHLLYSCVKPTDVQEDGCYVSKSHIFSATVHRFFNDHLSGYNAQIIVPTQKIQDHLEDMLLKRTMGYKFQENHYNAATKYFDLTQQNSNQFVSEAVAAAMSEPGEVTSRETAINVLKRTGYSPTKLAPTDLFAAIKIPVVQDLISSFMPTVCLASQPELQKYGIGEIVTSNSVLNWMRRNSLVKAVVEIGLDEKLMKVLDSDEKLRQAAKSKEEKQKEADLEKKLKADEVKAINQRCSQN